MANRITDQTPAPPARVATHAAAWRWFSGRLVLLRGELRLSYLPPLMVYMAAGISGLTSVVGTFFVKDYLGLSAAFLAGLGFWAGIPWALKMPVGHLVDLVWRWKALLVYLGAALIAVSLLIMLGLIVDRPAMTHYMSAEAWYVLSVLLAPIGYVIQDCVADAMTVEAVPSVDEHGRPLDEERRKLMHTTMQTLGRVAIIGGGVLVAAINLYVFVDTGKLPPEQMTALYAQVYLMALSIPAISVLGVVLAAVLKARERRRLAGAAVDREPEGEHGERPHPNWAILGGSLVFVVFSVAMGLSDLRYSQEMIFAGSFAIVVYLMAKLTRELDPTARETLIGTAVVIFVFRAVPLPGPGVSWWMIDRLGFDPEFFSVLDLTAAALTLAGMLALRRFMARRSITYIVGVLTLAAAVLSVPYIGMFYGLHEWTSRLTHGVVDARFIALANTAIESPLGQISMIPMLAWIARSAPDRLKATYFAVMASFTNLALSLSQLGGKHLNSIFVVSREVRDPVTGALKTAADYSELGNLLIAQTLIALALPIAAILIARACRWRTA
jgi:hypothetical protein